MKRTLQYPFLRLGTASPAVRVTVAEVVQECTDLGLLDDLRTFLGVQTAEQSSQTLRAVRDLTYELAGTNDRNLSVDVLIHATGLAEFDQRTLRDYARKHGMTAEGFRRHVVAMRHRLGLDQAHLRSPDAN